MKVRRPKRPRLGEAQAAMKLLYSPVQPLKEEKASPLSITFMYPGEPVPAMRPRVTRNGTYTPRAYLLYKRGLSVALRAAFGHLFPDVPASGTRARSQFLARHRYRLAADFHLGNRRPVDGDNLLKALLDAVQDSGLILNDSQVDEVSARKHIDPQNPRVEFTLEELS